MLKIKANNWHAPVRLMLGALLSTVAFCAHSESIKGRVVRVLDGDTLILLDSRNVTHTIRLAVVDAPEIGHGAKSPGQPFGQNSKRALAELCAGVDAEASLTETVHRGRYVAYVTCKGVDAGSWMLDEGLAWVWSRYNRGDLAAHYRRLQQDARASKRGLWNDPEPVEPWKYRSQLRSGA